VFKNGTNFPPDEQAQFLLALFVIFNFICIVSLPLELSQWEPEDNFDPDLDSVLGGDYEGNEGELGGSVSNAERHEADKRCDEIAKAMWEQYIASQDGM
jgi:hypothetical protein